jgi:hypothetical protein
MSSTLLDRQVGPWFALGYGAGIAAVALSPGRAPDP